MLLRPGPDPEVFFPCHNFAFILIDRTEGISNYHAGFVRLEKRFWDGFYFNAHHTWSKGLSLASSACSVGNDACLGRQNVWNLRADYGPNSYDVTHRFVFSGIWELPFGRGKRFGSDLPAAAEFILGGWQAGGTGSVPVSRTTAGVVRGETAGPVPGWYLAHCPAGVRR